MTVDTTTTWSISIQRWLSGGWRLFRREPFLLLLATLFYFCVVFGTFASYRYESIGPLGYFLLNGPLILGFYAFYFELIRGNPVNFSTFFEGFRVYLPAVLAQFVLSVLLSLGYFFFILPGLILEALFIFTYPLILEKRLGVWEAMRTSKNVVSSFLFEFSGYVLLKWILYLLGMSLLGIGILFVFPWFLGSVAVAYSEIFGLEENEQPL